MISDLDSLLHSFEGTAVDVDLKAERYAIYICTNTVIPLLSMFNRYYEEKDDHSFEEIQPSITPSTTSSDIFTTTLSTTSSSMSSTITSSTIDWDALDAQVAPQIPQHKRKRTLQLIASTNKIKGCYIEYWPTLYPISKAGELVITLTYVGWRMVKRFYKFKNIKNTSTIKHSILI